VDDAQVDELRRWAAGLSEDSRPELKAAARAIHLLCDDVLAARSQLLEERLIREALEAQDDEQESEVGPHLLARVRSLLGPRVSREET
jgi:hypothetical protein